MKTATLLQWLAAGAAMSVVLTIGHPASADEAIEHNHAHPRPLESNPPLVQLPPDYRVRVNLDPDSAP